MITENKITIININSSEELKKYWIPISVLFNESFGKEIDIKLWEWAYIDNPFGDPLLSLALSGDRVVGHYAVIPTKLKNSKCYVDSYLAMTTMVEKSFRKHGLFKILAENVYEQINLLNKPTIVYGFPNDKAVPGLKKRLGWTICDEYSVVKLKSGQEAEAKIMLQNALDQDGFKFDLTSENVRNWRCNKPEQLWNITNGIGLKENQFGTDMMYFDSLDDFESLTKDKNVNVILANADSTFDVLFNYRFGYRTFNLDDVPTFIVEMCMSDVF